MNQFGSLGLGSGGFSPMFPVGFMEMIRVLVYGLEETQRAIPKGASSVLFKMLDAKDAPDGHSLNTSGRIHMEHLVKKITKDEKGKLTLHVLGKGTMKEEGGFDAVIVSTTTRAMQDMGLTEGSLLSTGVKTAIRNLHMCNASKLFLRTKDKFWIKNSATVPQNIQTDALPRGIYCVDYPEADGSIDPEKPGCLLLSYCWGDGKLHICTCCALTTYISIYINTNISSHSTLCLLQIRTSCSILVSLARKNDTGSCMRLWPRHLTTPSKATASWL